MELRDYTEDEIEALVAEIGLGQMMRDAGASPMIPQYDVPRDAPSLRSGNTRLGDVAGQYMHPMAGEAVSHGQRVLEQAPEFAYQASGLGLAEHGGESVSKGMNEGDYARVAGGVAEVGLAALPFSGRALGAAYKTIPRALGVGAAYGASPLVAAGVLSPKDAQASEAGLMDRLGGAAKDHGVSVALSAALGAIPGIAYKTKMKRGALEAQQEIADLGQVLSNREVAQAAKQAKPDVGFQHMVDADIRQLEPPIYHNYTDEYLDAYTMGNAAQKAEDIQHINRDGAIVGGLGGTSVDYANNIGNEDHSFGQSLASGVGGAFLGYSAPALTRSQSSPVLQSRIQQYNPQSTLDRTRPLVQPVSSSHPPEVRRKVLDKLKNGDSVATLSRDYGVSQTAIRRWVKMEEKASQKTSKPKKSVTPKGSKGSKKKT